MRNGVLDWRQNNMLCLGKPQQTDPIVMATNNLRRNPLDPMCVLDVYVICREIKLLKHLIMCCV